ncbi:unnamed protein product [Pseudo-nitzschia multistriata]|uniref:Uncharacterized protein n=1 Tax=Pseudo-nitzschia multistriata TaxID=183589 RepID=A0A448ZPU6_9STRA|nr:unnamed protein product [Pseudo-nitzschia multistriata]
MAIPHTVANLVDRASNSASSVAATDRASVAPLSPAPVEAGGARMLACSSSGGGSASPGPSVRSLQAKLIQARKRNELLQNIEKGVDEYGYPLCEFRKGFLDHYKPRGMVISTIRVALQQSVTILANFMGEQLELDLKRNQRVNEGQITQMEADLEADEWEKLEWDKRWTTFPNKFVTALVKYHSVTLILRFYEYLAAKLVDMHKLNKLTVDPFAMARRMSSRIEAKSPPGKTETVRDHKLSVTASMTTTTLWANLLPFCADYSLHQALLCYAYFRYYSYQRQRRLLAASPSSEDDDEDTANGASTLITEDDRELARDLGQKSLRLATNRGVGLVCSAVGAGVGTVVWPGWGTIVFSALGDATGGMITDDGYFKAKQSLEEKRAKDEARDDSISRQVQ